MSRAMSRLVLEDSATLVQIFFVMRVRKVLKLLMPSIEKKNKIS